MRRFQSRASASFGCRRLTGRSAISKPRFLTDMPYEHLTTRREGPVEYLTLNRPDVRNAFNEIVIAELTDWASHARDLADRRELRVAVVAGAGEVFSAGADVRWMAKMAGYTEEENLRDA